MRHYWRLALAVAGVWALWAAPAALGQNAGDVWVQNVGQAASPGHATEPHLACGDINLWASGVTDSSGDYTIVGQPPTGTGRQAYASTWQYDTTVGRTQLISVISVPRPDRPGRG
jgi:hypothetical protein